MAWCGHCLADRRAESNGDFLACSTCGKVLIGGISILNKLSKERKKARAKGKLIAAKKKKKKKKNGLSISSSITNSKISMAVVDESSHNHE